MKNTEKLLDDCTPDMLPKLTETKLPAASRRRIRRLVASGVKRSEQASQKSNPLKFSFIPLQPIAAALTLVLGIALTLALIPAAGDFIAGMAQESGLTQGELPQGEMTLEEIVEDSGKLYIRFLVKADKPQGAAAFCRSLELISSNGEVIGTGGWDLDDNAALTSAMLAGEVFCGTIEEEYIRFQIVMRKSEIAEGETLTLKITDFVTADCPDGTETILYPLYSKLELSFKAENYIPYDALDKTAETISIDPDNPLQVLGSREADDMTYIKLRIDTDPLLGQFIVCSELRLSDASTGKGIKNWGGLGTSANVKQYGAMIMAGDVLTVAEKGAEYIEFEINVPTAQLTSIMKLEISDLVCIDTYDAIDLDVYPLEEVLSVTFKLN